MFPQLNDKSYFITGGSGFVGGALVARLILDTRVKHVYLLCRGGEERLYSVWAKNLSPSLSQELYGSGKITVWDGDIEKPNLGLLEGQLRTIQDNAEIIVHCASSINLGARLPRLVAPVIDASLAMAWLAKGCEKLERFIYVSTAMSNTHLHDAGGKQLPAIEERLYPLQNGNLTLETAERELLEVHERGAITEDHMLYFPFAYGYAKHLTERLITNMFHDDPHRLLIIRPSIIGPALSFPYPNYEVAGSAPLTMCAAGYVLEPGMSCVMSSPYADPLTQAHHDEVPVDVVVNRLVAHLAAGTTGVIHAVAGRDFRFSVKTIFEGIDQERRLPWKVRLKFQNVTWHAKHLHLFARIFKIMGTDYTFDQQKTVTLVESLDEKTLSRCPMFAEYTTPRFNHRRKAIRANAELLLEKTGRPTWLIKYLCKPELAAASL